MENEDLKAQIQDKVFVITSLKNNLRKLKGKEFVKNASQIPSATTITPSMFKLDLVPLPPRLLQNWETHIDYIKHTQENANILREIVKLAKAKQPLDSELDFACCPYCTLVLLDSGTTRLQGLWGMVAISWEMMLSQGSGPEIQYMTPATSSTGLVSNLISQQPCIPPIRDDWDRLFQPMFDEYF
ncbi:hypothetical protein Tco_1098045, partial [Tanacetum coccineum]